MMAESHVDPWTGLEELRAEEILLLKGSQTTTDQRSRFFTRTNPRLAAWLVPHWHWWFRLGFHSGIEPIVAVARGQIIGHAGTLPFAFRDGEAHKLAVWFLAFAVVPECQGHGLGKRMTEEWMGICPNPVTECNQKSMAIFKKYGWEEAFHLRRFARVIDPTKFADRLPQALRIAVPITRPLYRSWLRWSSRSAPRLIPQVVPSNPGAMADLFEHEPAAPIEILRNDSWIQWRVLESPFLSSYRIFRHESATALVRGFVSDGVRRLHILYVNRPRREEDLSILLRGLVRWAGDDRVDLIWAVARSIELMRLLRLSLPIEMGVRIGAYNTNMETMSRFLNPGFPIQAIDSDIDLAYPEDPGSVICWN